MFGQIKPTVKNLRVVAGEWFQNQTFTRVNQGTSPQSQIKMRTTTAAASGAQQASPAIEWEGQGWKTNSVAASQAVSFRSYAVGVQATVNPIGSWKLESSVNGGAWTSALEMVTTIIDGTTLPRFNVTGAIKSSLSNSSTVDTISNFDLQNPSGTRINMTYTFGSTIKGAIQVQDGGATYFKAAGSGAAHYFQVGSTISAVSDAVQISAVGIYNYGGSFNQGRVTAGGADVTPPAFLNTNGSFAVRGTLKIANATLNENETMIYCDASNANICSGTPTACSTYATEGTCNAHSAIGCSWFAGNDCSGFGDQSTCEAQSGCTWTTASCSVFTDQSSCEAQSPCAWVLNDCATYVDQGNCEGNGCTWNFSDCSGFGDQSSCEAQSPCTWNGSACEGQYNTSCSGTATTGNCTGNYPTGPCTGTYGAACQGTALCGNLTTSGACATEAGCSWVSGMTLTLPLSSDANDGNTSRIYSIVNIGATGTVTVVANTGDTILGYGSGVVLNAQNERVMLHHHNLFTNCNTLLSEGACNAQSGCTWTAAIVCADYVDESSCNAQSGAGCSWDGSSCSGAGTAAACSGIYTSSKPWVIHQLSN
jgi:hypothetical protein